jgi:hypothetical protein
MRPLASVPAAPFISLSDSVPASVITAGIERSTLPGLMVTTAIWPRPTSTENEAKVSVATCTVPGRDVTFDASLGDEPWASLSYGSARTTEAVRRALRAGVNRA